MPSLKLTQFGGIAPRQRPNNLPQAMAQVAEDVDLSRGSLRPWRTDKKVSSKTGKVLFVDKCCYLTSDNCKASYSRIDTDCCFIVASGVKDYPVIQHKENACNGRWNRLGLPMNIQPSLKWKALANHKVVEVSVFVKNHTRLSHINQRTCIWQYIR